MNYPIDAELILRSTNGDEVVVRKVDGTAPNLAKWATTGPIEGKGKLLLGDLSRAFTTLAEFTARTPITRPRKKKS